MNAGLKDMGAINELRIAPLQQLVDLPQVVQMTIRVHLGVLGGHRWECDISIGRYDESMRFFAKAAPVDQDRAPEIDFDVPRQAFITPATAFWAAVAFIDRQIEPIIPA